MDPLGPVCEKCKCHGHAETCHPHTGECIQLKCISDQCPECYEGEEGCGQCVGEQCGDPGSDPQTKPPWVVIDVVVYCQFHPDKCVPPDIPDSTVDIYFISLDFIRLRNLFIVDRRQYFFMVIYFIFSV